MISIHNINYIYKNNIFVKNKKNLIYNNIFIKYFIYKYINKHIKFI